MALVTHRNPPMPQPAGDLVVHAGVAVWQGRAIVLPGDSGVGKSTLVAALEARGARVLADDMVTFDARSREAFGSGMQAPIGAFVFTRFTTHRCFEPRALSSGEAALALLRHVTTPRSRACSQSSCD